MGICPCISVVENFSGISLVLSVISGNNVRNVSTPNDGLEAKEALGSGARAQDGAGQPKQISVAMRAL